MTTYFDNIRSELNQLACASDNGTVYDRLEAIEKRMVRDVTLCAEWPGCPPQIRQAIHASVLRYSTTAQIRGCILRPTADYADTAENITGIINLCEELHSAFHSLSHLNLAGFNDSPLTPLLHLEGVGEDAREAMSEPDIAWWRRAIADYEEADRPEAYDRVAARAYTWTLYRTKGDVAAATRASQAALADVQAVPPTAP